MKHVRSLAAGALAALLLAGCGAPAADPQTPADTPDAPSLSAPADQPLTFTDALGYPVTLESWDRVVSLYGSFAETWTLAGGTLVGATSDAIEERHLDLGDAAVVGTVKEPNLEEIIAADPDFVILSADISAQADFHEALTQAGIPHAYYQVDTFAQYLAMLEQFCAMTGRADLYQQNGLAVQTRIDQVLAAVEGRAPPPRLLSLPPPPRCC